MARCFYLNMEQLSIQVAREQAALMTDSNRFDDERLYIFIDETKFIPNIKRGMIVITMLTCYIESFLNSIISSCLNYEGDTLLKLSMEEKMDVIFLSDPELLKSIKSRNEYRVYKKTNQIRNELIHFKKSWISDGSGLMSVTIKKHNLESYFTKTQMEFCCDCYEKLLKMIASNKGLSIYKNVGIIACDGRDGLVNYVFKKDGVDIDDSRDDLDTIYNI